MSNSPAGHKVFEMMVMFNAGLADELKNSSDAKGKFWSFSKKA